MLSKAEMVVRKGYEKMLIGKGSLIIRESIKNPITSVTELKEKTKATFPCRISHGTGDSTTDNATQSEKRLKLFTKPDQEIPEGSRIDVIQNNKHYKLKLSGIPSVYSTHREYSVEEWTKWQ